MMTSDKASARRRHCSPLTPLDNPGLVLIHAALPLTLEEVQQIAPATRAALESDVGVRTESMQNGVRVRMRFL